MTNAPTAHSLGASRIAKVSTLDFSLFIIGGVAVVVALVVIAAMTMAAFTRMAAAPLALAIRTGLLGLLVGEAIRVWMIAHGMSLVNAGTDLAPSR